MGARAVPPTRERGRSVSKLEVARPRVSSPRRKPSLPVLIAGAVALLLVGALIPLFALRGGSSAAAAVGVLHRNVGVEIGGRSLKAATAADRLRTGDTVQTDPAGQAEVRWFKGSVTRLDVNTRFTLGDLIDKPGRRVATGKLHVGRVWNRVAKLTTKQDRFEIGSPHAIAAVRGTAFIVDCRHLPTCYFTVIDGFVLVTTSDGKSVLLTAGQSVGVDGAGHLLGVRDVSGSQLLRDPWIRANLVRDGKSEVLGDAIAPVERAKARTDLNTSSSPTASSDSSTQQTSPTSSDSPAVVESNVVVPPTKSSGPLPSNLPPLPQRGGGGGGGGGGGNGGGGGGNGGGGGGGGGGGNAARMSGVVTDSTSGTPIAGARVRDATASKSTLTASDGSYALRGLTSGPQTIRIRASGYDAGTKKVRLAQGENTENFDLLQQATLSGTVTDAQSGSPVSGVTVAVGSRSAKSAADGTYTVTNAPTGSQTVTATATGYQSASATATINPGTNSLDFVLVPATASTGTVTGHVTDATTTSPISGAAVSIGSRSTQTATDGSYTISNVPTGSQSVTASATGYQSNTKTVTVGAGSNTVDLALAATTSTTGTVTGHVTDGSTTSPIAGATVSIGSQTTQTASDGSYTISNVPTGQQTVGATAPNYRAASQNVTVQRGTNTANFALQAAGVGTISGVVTDATSGSPIGGATVSVGCLSAQTASDGSYTIDGVATGSQTVFADATGYQSSSQNVDVASGPNTVNFSLTAIQYGTVTGTVKDASTGAAISGATVEDFSGGSTQTATDGSYTLTNVPTGNQTIEAFATNYQSSQQNVTVTTGTTTANFTLTAIQRGTVTGTVKDASTNAAIAAATVEDFSGHSTQTASDGSYTLNNVPTGQQTIEAFATNYQSSSQSVTVTTGTTTANFTLTAVQRGTVTGAVTDSSTGAAVSGATVEDFHGDSTRTAGDGTYTLSGVPTGSQTIEAFATNYQASSQSVSVTTGTTTANFALTAAQIASVTGTVTDASTGAPIAGATVATSSGCDSTQTDGNGNYTLSNLQTGPTEFIVTATGYQGVDRSVTLVNGSNTVNFQMTGTSVSTATVSGTVTDASTTRPISGATVTDGSHSTQTASDGTYTLSNLATGSQTIIASASGYQTSSKTVSLNSGTNTVDFALGATTAHSSIERESVSSTGAEGNGISLGSFMSADGRYVAFHSSATDLVPGDTNGQSDAFVRDRQTGTTTRVSVASDGSQSSGSAGPSSISADGRYVVINSNATDLASGASGHFSIFIHDMQTGTTQLVISSNAGDILGGTISGNDRYIAFNSDVLNPGGTAGQQEVYVYDLQAQTLELISKPMTGTTADGLSDGASISADGRYVAFGSYATNLVANDTNGQFDDFVRDRQTGTTQRVSVASDGTQGDNTSESAVITPDGTKVVFWSYASNLVAGDTIGGGDVFVHSLTDGSTVRESLANDGSEANGTSSRPSISDDGRYIAFESTASNLVTGDSGGQSDIFVRDTQSQTTSRVTIGTDGSDGNGTSVNAVISGDGSMVTFESLATNLVPGDTNGVADIFGAPAGCSGCARTG